ncbi:MAG: dihydroorotate dehydrogenase-like protein [Prolixibacteraceae bacterium]|nr:dihydroorotate dehydrogenase-like protein [Prolixibacteraceae bacterium]
MIDLKTNYMGLKLKSPIIAGSSGLTNSVKQIKQLEEAGVGAVVLKSLFEEQIMLEVNDVVSQSETNTAYPEAEDYIRNYTKINSVQKYMALISEAKTAVDIPVIASINCVSAKDWTDYATEIEEAGADGIELNIFNLPTNRNKTPEVYEQKYYEILKAVKAKTKLPLAVKISPYFSNMVRFVDQLFAHGASAVVMFNRFYEPDFDLDKLDFTSSEVMSSPADLNRVLRWTGIVKGSLPKAQLAASTGIHDGAAVIKQLLAGAQVTQLCSTLYLNGFDVVKQIEDDLKAFMQKWRFQSVDEFRGRLSYSNIGSPEVYERAQFMKYFSNRKGQ